MSETRGANAAIIDGFPSRPLPITDGVQYLIDQGIADPKRIGIFGGSYGGYATLAGVSLPDQE